MQRRQIYQQQYRWRRWSSVYPDLGDLTGTRIMDLGCGIGDQSRDLSRLGADVLGVDANREFIQHAESRRIPRARFVYGKHTDMRLNVLGCDGVWLSFTAAYFPRFDSFLRSIDGALRPGGWLAITEVDDLFAHGPLDERWRAIIEKYYARSLEEGVYRFRSHDHVRDALSELGWHIEIDRKLDDDEFCFDGAASSDILDAWKNRLGFMMPRFLERFGDKVREFDSALLRCLASEEHRSRSRVWFILARSPSEGEEGG